MGAAECKWKEIVESINALGFERVFVPASTSSKSKSQQLRSLDQACLVYSFDDIVWEVASDLVDRYADKGLRSLIDANSVELNVAYGGEDYQLDSSARFAIFVFDYTSTRGGWEACEAVPTLFREFEAWLHCVDPNLLERLRVLRAMILAHRHHPHMAQNDNSFRPGPAPIEQ